MRRSDRIRLGAIALLLGIAEARVDAEPAAQRYSAPISIAQGAPFVRVPLSAAVYAHSLQADLRDLRIVDAAGERVPFALLAPDSPPAASEQLRDATLYPLPPRPIHGGTWTSPVDVTVDGDRISVHRSSAVAARPEPSPGTSPGWLIDLGELRRGDAPARRIRLAWSGPAEFSASYAIETSDDLRSWRAGAAGQVMSLQSASGALTQPLVALPDAAGRFVRLVWTSSDAVPVLTGATALAPAPGVVAADSASELVFDAIVDAHANADADVAARTNADAASRRTLQFDLGGDLPIVDVDLRFASGTHVVPARVQGRSRADEPWRDLGAGVFYRLERDGTVAESPAIATPIRARFVRLVPDERSGTVDAKGTRLVVHARLPALIFATSGQAPFRLLAGSADASEGALPATTLVPRLDDERARFGRAELGAFSEEPEVARAADRAELIARLRPWLLWSVLLVGVIALAALVWRLAQGAAPPRTPEP